MGLSASLIKYNAIILIINLYMDKKYNKYINFHLATISQLSYCLHFTFSSSSKNKAISINRSDKFLFVFRHILKSFKFDLLDLLPFFIFFQFLDLRHVVTFGIFV